MTERRALVSGDVLDDRYVLQDLVTERLGATTWRAHDRVLSRNVGLEMIASDDARADHFLDAARQSTSVSDPRFLRVLDLVDDDHGHHIVVREWARAISLDQVLAQSPMPNRRSAHVVAEVAEALAHAHERGVYHRRLTPHQVLLKESGGVRVVGLGVATALAPVGHQDTIDDLHIYEQRDVTALGKLLYACLVARWPGAHVDQLRAAPTEHGRLLRPRQVRAGVSREVDMVCDRILGDPPQGHRRPLRTASDIAHELHLIGEDIDEVHAPPNLAEISSPDLLRLDPVVEPVGPPPGLEPPRRRPKAYEPAPPTPFERGKARAVRATQGDRGLVLLGVVGVIALLTFLGFLAFGSDSADPVADPAPTPTSAVVGTLPVQEVLDFDPQGQDREENPDQVGNVLDGDPTTGWQTSTYYNQATLGGLKDGVGLILDLGAPREVESVRVALAGDGTDVTIFAATAASDLPNSLEGLRRVATIEDAGADITVSFPDDIITRQVVVWLQRLPQIDDGEYRGEIREVSVRGVR
ncbi:protein kinase [Aeromicrobium sp. CTD01-1L150]|uniref:protein kinase domain-containing protein n=1 Tax=Aeromicrobium sp. CTD01-1L150 TaxID=3341830 RepID=UPI0035C0E423